MSDVMGAEVISLQRSCWHVAGATSTYSKAVHDRSQEKCPFCKTRHSLLASQTTHPTSECRIGYLTYIAAAHAQVQHFNEHYSVFFSEPYRRIQIFKWEFGISSTTLRWIIQAWSSDVGAWIEHTVHLSDGRLCLPCMNGLNCLFQHSLSLDTLYMDCLVVT